jgi:alkanesulfonate monooxygenase SsuD/methylene tetrahydromethanopterin reductase-like flavin-dependent oxidoreductase (luciferase family)
MHIGESSQAARDEFYPHYAAYFRDHAPKTTYATDVPREEFDRRASAEGPLFVGNAEDIVDKLVYEHELFGHDRYLAQIDIGGLPFAKVARTIELLATKVLPAVKSL